MKQRALLLVDLQNDFCAGGALAVAEGDKLIAEAAKLHGLTKVQIVHRIGILEVGETAVVIQVAAPHRREAFAGCEWIIDQLKWRVPIWKREHFGDGTSEWVGIGDEKQVSQSNDAFTRQIRLPFIGEQGQQKLRDARVLLVGVGGLGSAALPYLVASGIGSLGIVDGDLVEVTNLHRQILYAANEVGRGKAERAAAFARRINPHVQVQTFPERIDSHNAERILADYDWIVDGTDSLETKFLLNALCKRLGKALVTASIHQMEGQILTVIPDGPCLQCLFPEIPQDGCVGTCSNDGILGVVAGSMGIYQATEVLKGILGIDGLLSHSMLLVDLRTGNSNRLTREMRENCKGCEGIVAELTPFVIQSLADAESRFGRFDIVDIRELDETPLLAVAHLRQPRSELGDLSNIELEGPTVFICATGRRSFQLVDQLRRAGKFDAYSLARGVEGV